MAKLKKAILVVGSPRSGTSAVANIVNELGVDFGDPAKFLDTAKNKHNPIFFELESLNRLNDDIFAHYSKTWADFDWLPDRSDFSEDVCSKFELTITNFIEENFGRSELIGLKDPRFCYTLPLWEKVLTRIGFNLIYILVRRASSSVFISNKIVNRYSSSTNFQAVSQSNLLAARFVQSRPFITIFYEELLRSPETSIRDICKTANLPLDRIKKASSVLDANLQHHDDDFEKSMFKYFSDVIDAKEIDPKEYDKYREIYFTSTYEKNKKIENLNQELAQNEQAVQALTAQVAEKEQSVQALTAQVTEKEQSVQALTAQVAEKEQSMQALTAQVAEKEQSVQALMSQVAEKEQFVQALTAQVAEKEQSVQALTAQVAEKEQSVQALTAQVAVKEQSVQALTVQVREKDAKLNEIVNSKVWKFGLFFRRMRVILAPPNSRRARAMRALFMFIFFPLRKINQHRKIGKDTVLIKASGMFDEHWYLTQNPDIAHAGIDPARHYLRFGGFEGRDPSTRFSSRWYMDTYPDVRVAGINPLTHYLRFGGREGRIGKEGGEVSLNLMGGNTRGFTIYKLFRLVNKTTIKKSIVYIRTYGLKFFIKKAKSIIKKSELHGANLYENWIFKNEPEEVDLLIQKRTKFKYQPKISIVVPVWNTPLPILDEMIVSVINQTYSNWELCIADGDSNPVTRARLKEWAAGEKRINLQLLDENMGIVGNSNAALSRAQGEFMAFLDHDDTLALFALFEVVQSLQNHTESDVIYSDEDKLDEHNKRFDAFFKPDFSPDYLHSVNYMPHFLVVRKSLGDEIGWFREGCDGAQDYDLILRAVEKARFIAHIPKILYHWRVWSESTAGGAEVKPYANSSGKKALQEHLERIGQLAQVEDGYASTFYRVHYQHPNTPLISIIIPTHDHAEDLERCVDSILQKTRYPNFEIILVENGSKEQETFNLYEQLKQDVRIHIIKWEQPFNYSHINNWAVTQANGEIILFLNNDTQVINGEWLEEMLQFALRSDVGAVGAKLYYPDESIQHAGVIIGLGGVAGHSHKQYPRQHPGYFGRLVSVQNVSAVTAACLMVRKQILQEVSGFDETYALAFGDVDLCLSILQKGYLNVWTPYAELYHHESKTRGYEDTTEKQKRFKKEGGYFKGKWAEWLNSGDPYYNPNLTLDHEDFRLKE